MQLSQNFLVFQTIPEWKSNGLSNGKLTRPHRENKSLSPKNVVNLFTLNLFVADKLDLWLRDLNTNFTLKDCLFLSGKLRSNCSSR